MENILKRYKDCGSCRALRGTVAVCAVFVQEPGNVWTEAEIREQQTAQTEALQYLLQQARVSGVPLRFRQTVRRMNTQRVWAYGDVQGFEDAYANSEGKRSLSECVAALNAAAGTEQAAFVFLFKKEGVSFASCASSVYFSEAVFMYGKLHFPVLHELLHLFGAVDLFYPPDVTKEAVRLFPRSVMYNGADPNCRELDDLTRYLIGWTDQTSPKAMALLHAGAGLTADDIQRGMAEVFNAEYTTVSFPDGVYYGPIKNWHMEGRGRMEWNDGAVYEGDFVGGRAHGRGTLRTADGRVYRGVFVNGKFRG